MNPDRYEQLKQAFARACELGLNERAAFLEELGRRDSKLREEVQALLDHDGRELPIEEPPAVAQLLGLETGAGSLGGPDADGLVDDSSPRLPESIGRYRIVELLAEGGMGVVYVAEQVQPSRLVALKVIRPDLITKSMIRRLQNEADILGRLQHATIAQIYEADVAESESSWGQTIRQPFFAMELIRGERLTAHVRNNALDIRAALKLVARVCDGIDYAHQQGVIHRDLKPSNILVDGHGQPKILDFGVARAVQSDTPAATARTEVGQIIGTLHYMSPEQALGHTRDVDARSDIYSLGVIMYELIAGRLPHDVQSKSLAGAIHSILDEEAPKLGSINPDCRGDLETIVAKAMESDSAHRYESASDLAADLRRFLNDEPVMARPQTAIYQLRKFAKRNKGLVGGVIVAGVMLVLGMAMTSWFAWQSSQSARTARWATYKASISAALGAQRTGDPSGVRVHLQNAPEEHRNWEWSFLNAWLDTSRILLADDAAPESRIAITPDSASVRYLTDAGDIVQHGVDAAQRDVLCHIEGPAPIRILDWSGDSSRVVYATGDHVIHVRDLQTEPRIIQLADHGKRIASAHLSPDASRLVSVGRDDAIRVWDLEAGDAIHVLEERTYGLAGAVFSNDGRSFYAYNGPEVRQWDSETGELLNRYSFPDYDIKNLEFATDDRYAVAYSIRREIHWIDFQTQAVKTLIGHTARVHSVRETGGHLVSVSADKSIRIWDVNVASQVAIMNGHRDAVEDFALSPDRKWLASRGSAGELRLWSLAHSTNPRVLRGHQSYIYPVKFRPDGGMFATGSWDNTVRLWDPVEGEQIGVLSGFSGALITATFNPEGDRFVTGIRSQMVQLFDAFTFQQIAHRICGRSVHAIAYNPDGAAIVVSSRPDGLFLLDSELNIIGRKQLEETANALCFRPDGSSVACAYTGIVRVLSPDLSKTIAVQRIDEELRALAYSPDGSVLAVGGASGEIRILGASSVSPRSVLKGHAGAVYSLRFTSDGDRLISASEDRTIRFWDVDTWESVAELRGHENYVYAVDMSPDGSMLVSSSGDHTVRIWDTLPGPERERKLRQARRLGESAAEYVSRQFGAVKDPSLVAENIQTDAEITPRLRMAAALELTRQCGARAVESSDTLSFPQVVHLNTTGADDTAFLGEPDGRSFSLGRGSVTYDLQNAGVLDDTGPDINVFEVDTGDSSFGLVDVLVSEDGTRFESIKKSEAPTTRLSVSSPTQAKTFVRSYDLTTSSLRRARYIRIQGISDLDPGDWPSFDLDAVGIVHFEK